MQRSVENGYTSGQNLLCNLRILEMRVCFENEVHSFQSTLRLGFDLHTPLVKYVSISITPILSINILCARLPL